MSASKLEYPFCTARVLSLLSRQPQREEQEREFTFLKYINKALICLQLLQLKTRLILTVQKYCD